MKARKTRAKKGISTVAVVGIIFIIITLSVLASLTLSFLGNNFALTQEMAIEDEKAREKIALTELGVSYENSTIVNYLRVSNKGTITVRIRAIYVTNTSGTFIISDPSKYMNTFIDPNQQLLITGPNGTEVGTFQPNARLILSTERGTKTSDYEGVVAYGSPQPPNNYDPSRYYIGPLELMFTAFYYQKIGQDGVLDPSDSWHPGWNITRSYGYVAWNITVRNIDNRTLTINKFSSFTVVPNESPPSDERTWYLEPVDESSGTMILIPEQIQHIVYAWEFPYDETGTKAQQIYSVPCRCLVFLTFYGWFEEPSGGRTTYAQTIPFEAAITVI